MTDLTANLNLPRAVPNMNPDGPVIFNDLIEQLDALIQLAVEDSSLSAPPDPLPAEGARYIVSATASGDWAGQEGRIALYSGEGWLFLTPKDGWRAWDRAASEGRLYRNGGWHSENRSARLGVGTDADNYNRFAVSAPATLLTHDGGGHQLKLNKAAAGDTASMLFQTGWAGRAEMGTMGGDDFAIKVSPDGSSWTTALTVDSATGRPNLAEDTHINGQTAYHRGNLLGPVAKAGGLPSGAVIERGSTPEGDYVRFADGTQICTSSKVFPAPNQADGALFTSATDLVWNYPRPFSQPPVVTGQRHYAGAIWLIGPTTASGTPNIEYRGRVACTTQSSGGRGMQLMALGVWT